MIKKYDNLDNNYLLGDGSVPIAINDAIPLEITDGEILTTLSLEDYNKIAFVVENDSTVNIDYLAMLGTQSSDSTIEIVKDVTASSGYALKLTGAQRIIFATKTSYVPDLLKKLTVKARCATGNTNTLTASLVGYQDGNFINKDGAPLLTNYPKILPLLTNYPKITSNEKVLTDSYTTHIGFVSGVGATYYEGTSTADAPSNMPTGTDEVAMILESSGGIFYVDVISLEEVPNSIRDIPEGTGVYNMVADISSDNRLTPSEKQTFKMQYGSIVAEYPIILATATARSLSGTDYTTAYDALVAYVASTGILDKLTVSTDISGSAFRTVVASYVEKKAKIQESINNFDASELTLSVNSNVIDISARGKLKTTYIYLEVTTTIISIDNIVWSATDGTTDYSSAIIDLVTPVVGQKRLDCSLIVSDSITVTASITENGKTYIGTQAIAVVQPNVYDVVNFGMVKEAPTETADGEPLSKGDYFLWGGDTTRTKGEIYEYNGTKWETTTNGDLVMTMFDSFADLANDVDSTVIGNAVIKKLVAVNAFIENLTTRDLLLNSGGAIRSEYYNTNGSVNEDSDSESGVYMNANGVLKVKRGEFIDADVSGKFTSSSLETFDALPNIDGGWGLSQDISVDTSWATPFTVGTRYWSSTAYGNGKFVAVGVSGYVSYSNDGITWATPFQVGTSSWEGITYGDGKFVAVGYNGYVSYSTNGITWVTPFTVGTREWGSIAYGDGKFVAGGVSGYVSYSTNGINWVTPFTVGTRYWSSIAYGDGKFVAVGAFSIISYSTDGITWATPFEVGVRAWVGVTYGDGKFVAAGDLGLVSYSTNGINWVTPFTVGASTVGQRTWNGITYSDGKFVAVGIGHTCNVSYSTDGINWATPFQVGTGEWNSTAYGDGKFVAVGVGGYVSYSSMILVRNIYDYLTTLLDTLTAPSGTVPSTGEPYTLPNTEPLLYSTYVSGMAIYDGTPYILAKLKVANNEISFTDDTGVTVPIRVDTPSLEDLQITGLTIIGASEENHVTTLIPKDGDGTGYVGSDGKRFAEVWADKVYGAVFN